MILHLRQIFLTLASTFISFSVRAERAVLIDSLRPDPQSWVLASPGTPSGPSTPEAPGHRIGGVPIPLKFVFFNKLSYWCDIR
jgi:hypothetical protein